MEMDCIVTMNMLSYGEKRKVDTMEKRWAVVVIGGGLGGCMAAIAAAREGKRVLLAERYGFLGGTAVAALYSAIRVMPICASVGEAAGILAARTCDVGDAGRVDYHDVQQTLTRHGGVY